MSAHSGTRALGTGFAKLDAALGGGLPGGSIVELFGPSGSGKTALAMQMAAHVQRAGGTAAWLDAEHAFHAASAAALGLKLEGMPVLQPDSAEEGLEIAARLAATHAVDLLVVDSAAALAPRLELEAGIGEAGPGLHSRVMASGLRRLAARVRKTEACVLFLNQTRTRRDQAGEEIETPAGGAPLKLYAAVRIGLSPVTASRVRFRILKNKAANAFGEGELDWRGQRGFAESP
jgi:recombination protein RecA